MIRIRHALKNKDKQHINLKFMYLPIINTLKNCFDSYNYKYDYKFYDEKKEFQANEIMPNDILIWVGVEKFRRIPWNKLKKRNIYTIFYQTEPLSSRPYINAIRSIFFHEIWDYSYRNIDILKKYRIDKRCCIRFLPPCFKENVFKKQNKNPDEKAIFLGARRPHWTPEFREYMQDNVCCKYNLWNSQVFHEFLDSDINGGIYLNFLKAPKLSSLALFRISEILSFGGIIISENTNENEGFEDLVDFIDINEMPNKINEYFQMEEDERMKIAIKRYNLYKKRFNHKVIFEKSGINDVFKKKNLVKQITKSDLKNLLNDIIDNIIEKEELNKEKDKLNKEIEAFYRTKNEIKLNQNIFCNVLS